MRLVDPMGCQLMSDLTEKGSEKDKMTRSMHLKYIAAIHLLKDWFNVNNQQIDDKFGLQIKQFSDLQYLNGSVFKE